MRRHSIQSVLFAGSILVASVASRADTLNIELKMKGTSFKVGEPVMLYVFYTYQGPHPIFVSNDVEPSEAGIVLEDADTKSKVHRRHEGEAFRLMGNGIGLSPGRQVEERVDLMRYYKLDAAGRYTVRIDKFYGDQHKTATSNSITFTLTQ